MKNGKKLLSLLLALIMCLSLLPAASAQEPEETGVIEPIPAEELPAEDPEVAVIVPAEDPAITETIPTQPVPAQPQGTTVASGNCGDNLTWVLDDAGMLTISGTGDMYDYMYDYHDTPPWAGKVKTVLLQNGITSIGNYAFDQCSSIRSIDIPDSVTRIGEGSFVGCDSLLSVTIPSGVTTIEKYAFNSCDNLAHVYILEGVKVIGEHSFCGCNSLSDICIPNSITTIEYGAFSLSGLTNVTISSNISFIGDYAFSHCSALRSIRFMGKAPSICDNTFYEVIATAFYPTGIDWESSDLCDYGGNIVWAPYNPIYIKAQPENVSAPEGEIAIFTIAAEGENLNYLWQYRPNSGCEWTDSAKETSRSATLNVSATASRNGYQFRCKVWNDVSTVYSDAATLTVCLKPRITTQPESVTAPEGETATFTIAAEGDNLNYLWQYRPNSNCAWTDSAKETSRSATLSVSATVSRNGYQFRCKVWNDVGTVFSNSATLTLITLPVISAQPQSIHLGVGDTAKFSVVASGGGLTYQWQWSADKGKTWKNSSSVTVGYNTSALQVTATAARNGYQYRCRICNAAGAVTSGVATLSVSLTPLITIQPKSVTLGVGDIATFVVAASGCDLSYQWQWSADDGKTWKDSSSATVGYNTTTLLVNVTMARNGYQYRCRVSNSNGSITSRVATLIASSLPIITTQPKSVSVSAGTNAIFTVATSGGSLSYQWQWSADDGKTWKNSSSATTGYNKATLQVTATVARNGYRYRCRITNANGSVYSSGAYLIVSEKPVIMTQPKSVSVADGATAKFTVSASGATSYQWQWSNDGGMTWRDSSSATVGYNSATLQVKAAIGRSGYQYRCVVSNSFGSVCSRTVTLTVE